MSDEPPKKPVRRHDVQADPSACPAPGTLSDKMAEAASGKSPAQWAYERMILYIKNFEGQLDAEHEVAMGLAGGDVGVMRIAGMGFFDPDIVTFYGTDMSGARTQLVQHVTQLSVMLRAVPKPRPEEPANRIGFRLAADIEEDTDGA
ncbi:DUF6173 family protein [Chachezhania antarctica]|mgnify:FL=1|uniref:DUF6173 family protein n=1 Tax=Chachezhania antarctica TaxID=2340860 RepID=UPI001F09CB32|nr:DUF6173 family protein [Chachezhania antarctica]